MKCIQVNLNGEPFWTIGHQNIDDLDFRLIYAPSVGAVHISANGLFSNGASVNEGSPWDQHSLGESDVITLQMVECAAPSVTTVLKEFDASTGESGLCCSFCGKSDKDVSKLVAGSNAFICDECINLCLDIVKK